MILSKDDIVLMRKAARLAAQTLHHVGQFVRAGITTNELDQIAYDYICSHNAKPAPLGYHGYPKSICTSVNHCICHGLPDQTVLKNGDAINIDVTCIKDGYHGDTSSMFFVGEVSDNVKKLTQCAKDAMYKGIEAITPDGQTGDIGFATQKLVTQRGFYPVKEIGGHGIGREFHTAPFVPAFGKKNRGEPLVPWTCLTVEPMVNETDSPIKEFDIPNSSIKFYETSDKTLSAQFEHTILITDTGYEILTVLD